FRVPYYEIDLVKSSGDVLCLIFELYCIIKKRDIELLKKRQVTANSQLEIERKKQMLRMQQDKEKKEADFKQRMLAKYGAGYGEMVSKRQVAVDMSKEMCLDAWGKPMNTYRTTTKYGQSEVWCYNYKTRVYFYNGKVVQIDD
ncbi:MAG: hypothetical protein J5792_06445, partial [Bacteroidales bacterium]|nr:hypothetical protein [Bacteroidales bacterium]